MRRFRIGVAVLAVWLLAALPGAACGVMPARAEGVAVPAGEIDAALLDAALRAEVDRYRCANGLPALEPARALIGPALAHSRWMAGTKRLTHDGRRTLSDRLKASALGFSRAAENVGQVPRYALGDGAFRVEDAGACRFSRDGKTLPPHSYASLARRAVALWMASPGHRRNIVDPALRRVAHGAAFEKGGPHCGRIWLTQTFAG